MLLLGNTVDRHHRHRHHHRHHCQNECNRAKILAIMATMCKNRNSFETGDTGSGIPKMMNERALSFWMHFKFHWNLWTAVWFCHFSSCDYWWFLSFFFFPCSGDAWCFCRESQSNSNCTGCSISPARLQSHLHWARFHPVANSVQVRLRQIAVSISLASCSNWLFDCSFVTLCRAVSDNCRPSFAQPFEPAPAVFFGGRQRREPGKHMNGLEITVGSFFWRHHRTIGTVCRRLSIFFKVKRMYLFCLLFAAIGGGKAHV